MELELFLLLWFGLLSDLINMITHNVNYLASKFRGRSGKQRIEFNKKINTLQQNILYIKKIYNERHLRTSFTKVQTYRKIKYDKLIILLELFQRKQETAFLSIKHKSYKKNQYQKSIRQKDKIFLTVIGKVAAGKIREYNQQVFGKMKSVLAFEGNLLQQLVVFRDIFGNAKIRLLGASFCRLKLASQKKTNYLFEVPLLIDKLQKIEYRQKQQTLQKLFTTTIKTNLKDMQATRHTNRNLSYKQNINKNDQKTTLKNKVAILYGQTFQIKGQNTRKINEAAANFRYRKKKKDEQLTKLSHTCNDFQISIEKMEVNLEQMQNRIDAKVEPRVSQQDIIEIYHKIQQLTQNDGIHLKQLFSSSKSLLTNPLITSFQTHPNSLYNQNLLLRSKLKHFQTPNNTPKKPSDHYTHALNQNSNLQEIVNSLIKTKYLQKQRDEMMEAVDVVEQNWAKFADIDISKNSRKELYYGK